MTTREVHQIANRFNRIMRADIDDNKRKNWLSNLQSDIEGKYDIDNDSDDKYKNAEKYVMVVHQTIVEARTN